MSDDLLTIDSFLADYRERAWMKDAACKGMDPDIFFPERGDSAAVRLIKATCSECPVKQQCADYGDRERFGFWGGMGTIARRRRRNAKEQ